MSNNFLQWGREQWYSPGDIVADLHRQHYRVYAIEYEDHCYAVDAYDLQGARVELKVSPKTRKIFSWIIRSVDSNTHHHNNGRQQEEGVVIMPEATVTVPLELVCL